MDDLEFRDAQAVLVQLLATYEAVGLRELLGHKPDTRRATAVVKGIVSLVQATVRRELAK